MSARLSSNNVSSARPSVPPLIDRGLVLRAGVVDALADVGVRVVLVVAPGGYGKTSHVAAWAARDTRPLVWITLEAVDNDPQVLTLRVVRALGAATDLGTSNVSVLGLMPSQYPTIAADQLGRALEDLSTPFVLVLDDVHVIESDASIDLLDTLVRFVPSGSELVLVGRSLRLASVARLRADVDVREITLHDLAVDEHDATLILEGLGVHASRKDVERVVAEVEGWPVGVRLAGLVMRRAADGASVPPSAPIAHAHSIADYVWSQWLATASVEDLGFLMGVSVLAWLSPPLCDHVLERHDSAQVLRRLQSDRLTVIPLARHGDSYRLHRLLRDVLAAELSRTDGGAERGLHLRASEWFEAAGDDDLAVHHALAGGDLERAERLVNDALPRLYTAGCSPTIRRWLDAFPTDYVRSRPSLCTTAGMTCLGLGDGDGAAVWLRFGEYALNQLGDAAGTVERAVWSTFRAMVRRDSVAACLDDAAVGCRDLPPGVWHAGACMVHGSLSWMRNDLAAAAAMLRDAAAEGRACNAPSVEAMARGRLALVCLSSGDVAAARRHTGEARQLQRDLGLDDMPTIHIVPAMAGLIAALDGHPDLALDEVRLSRRSLSYFDSVAAWVGVPTRLVLAEATFLLGDRGTTKLLLDEARRLVEVAPDAMLALERIDALSDRLHESGGSLAAGRFALTTAELRVLHYLPTNLRLAEIATRLYLSRFTVKTHISSIYRKLGAKNRTDAVTLARQAGLLNSDEAGTA